MLVNLLRGWRAKEALNPENLVGHSFIIKGKVGRGRKSAFIISSSSTPGKEVFLSLHGHIRNIEVQWKWAKRWSHILNVVNHLSFQYNTFSLYFCFQRAEEHVLGIIILLSSLGRMWVSFHYCFIWEEAYLILLLHGFVVKQTCKWGLP